MSPTPDMSYVDPDAHIDEEKFRDMLIQPLERFLCNGNPEEEFQVLPHLLVKSFFVKKAKYFF